MRLLIFIFLFLESVSIQAGNTKLNCSGVKIDAKFGAERARAGDSISQALNSLAKSQIVIDENLKKGKYPPMSIADKTQMKISFMDGYKVALTSKNTIDQIAAEASVSCTIAKYN